MAATTIAHIRLDDNGVAWIDDTHHKVLDVVKDKLAYGWSPEEIALQHYGELSLAQIHAALSYYYDHQDALDAEIARHLEEYDSARAEALNSPVRQKLRAHGLIP